jgi:hypothetical protein
MLEAAGAFVYESNVAAALAAALFVSESGDELADILQVQEGHHD